MQTSHVISCDKVGKWCGVNEESHNDCDCVKVSSPFRQVSPSPCESMHIVVQSENEPLEYLQGV